MTFRRKIFLRTASPFDVTHEGTNSSNGRSYRDVRVPQGEGQAGAQGQSGADSCGDTHPAAREQETKGVPHGLSHTTHSLLRRERLHGRGDIGEVLRVP